MSDPWLMALGLLGFMAMLILLLRAGRGGG